MTLVPGPKLEVNDLIVYPLALPLLHKVLHWLDKLGFFWSKNVKKQDRELNQFVIQGIAEQSPSTQKEHTSHQKYLFRRRQWCEERSGQRIYGQTLHPPATFLEDI